MADAILGDERVRVHGAIALSQAHAASPGTVLAAGRDGIDVACGDGVLRIRVLQREGGTAITSADYLNARPQLKTP
jgi:methionyl-tRNA formyltransferase